MYLAHCVATIILAIGVYAYNLNSDLNMHSNSSIWLTADRYMCLNARLVQPQQPGQQQTVKQQSNSRQINGRHSNYKHSAGWLCLDMYANLHLPYCCVHFSWAVHGTGGQHHRHH